MASASVARASSLPLAARATPATALNPTTKPIASASRRRARRFIVTASPAARRRVRVPTGRRRPSAPLRRRAALLRQDAEDRLEVERLGEERASGVGEEPLEVG